LRIGSLLQKINFDEQQEPSKLMDHGNQKSEKINLLALISKLYDTLCGAAFLVPLEAVRGRGLTSDSLSS
jgi:hypothetical protein